MMRKLFKLFVALIVVIIVGVIAVFFYIDQIAKTAIERGSTYALGVDTKLDSADVGVFSGQLKLKILNVDNPEGFAADHFLNLSGGDMQVTLNSLRQDVVRVPYLRLTGADISLEKKSGQANYRVILDNLKKLQGDQPSEGKRFIIDELVIRDLKVNVDLLGIKEVAQVTQAMVPKIAEIKLTEVGAKDGRGVTISELSGLVLKAMLASIAEQGSGLIPEDMLGDLRGKLSELADLDKLAQTIDLGDLQKKAEEIGVPKEITDRAQDELDKAKGKIGDLLGDDRKDK
jgi:uncharacterized protein involved in outer membrane biogenesis